MRRKLIQNITLVLASVSLTLGGVYLVLRLTGVRPESVEQVVENVLAPCVPASGPWLETVQAAVTDYRTPCARFYWQEDPTGEFHHQVSLNNYGLNDTDFSLEKPDGIYRLLVLGDSFAQGWQVPREQGFPALVESMLNRDENTQTVEVLNFGVDAYGTDRELLLYAALGERFQPDAVILVMYTGNDIQDNQIDLEERRYGYRLNRPYFSLDSGALQVHHLPQFAPDSRSGSPAARWLAALAAQPAPDREPSPPEHPAVISTQPYTLEYPVELGIDLPEDAHWTEAWQLTEALVMQLRDLISADSIPFGIVIIPDRRAVHAEDWSATVRAYPQAEGADPLAPGTRLETLIAAQGIPVLNLTNSLRAAAASGGTRMYYPVDGHFNAEGHTAAAQRISSWLRSAGITP